MIHIAEEQGKSVMNTLKFTYVSHTKIYSWTVNVATADVWL